MKNWLITIWSICFMLLLGSNMVQGQTIRGIVTDDVGPLPGVSVAIKGSNLGTVTDGQGKFELQGFSAGTLTVEISFIGYTTYTKEISIGEGEGVDLGTIELSVTSEVLKEVVVSGSYLPSQMRALNIQKLAPGIMNVLASDAIGKLPDRNAAEAVQRIQGVSIERDHGEGRYVVVRGTPIKWNSNLINGNRLPSSEGTSNDAGGDRAVPLDIFPSEMIEYVQLSKAITPDMEGDAIGGSVNFLTRTAPYQRMLNVSVAGGYNNQAQNGIYNGSVLYGDRFLNDKLGLIASATVWDRNWGTDNYEVVYNADLDDPIQQFSIGNLELRDYIGRRRTLGFNLGTEYKFNDDHKLLARGIYTQFQDNEQAREYLFDFNEGLRTTRTRNGITRINLTGGEVGGDHRISKNSQFDWSIAHYQNELRNDFLPESEADGDRGYLLAFFEQETEFGGLSPDGFKYLDIDAPAGVQGDDPDNIQPNALSPFIREANVLSLLYSFDSYSLERDWVGQLNFNTNITDDLKLKVGAKYRTKYREGATTLRISIPGAFFGIPGTTIPFLSDFTTEEFPENGGFLTELGENYSEVLNEHVTIDQLHDIFTTEGKNEFGFVNILQDENDPDGAGAFYNGTENVLAGYIMAEYNITDKLKFIGGVRHEITDREYNGNEVIDEGGDDPVIRKVTNSNTTNAFLPMVHLKFSPMANLNIRAAYTRSFARPDFADLNPGSRVDQINRTIIRGNPGLEPTFANNYDLMAEYYFSNVGVLSGGLFYKQISNDIYTSSSIETIDNVLYTVVEPRNLEKGYLFGFEVGLSKRLDFLPGFLSGLGVDANYTFTDSEVNVPSFSFEGGEIIRNITPQKLPSQADHIFNASLFYERSGLLVRLAANYKGSYIVTFSDFGPEHNRWYGNNLTVDLSSTYKISEKLRLFAEVNNLTNTPLIYYHGISDRPEQVEYYSIRGQLGIRFGIFE